MFGSEQPVALHSTSPAYGGDFPDPCILNAGGTYWAYATGSAGLNLQVMYSPDLSGWSPVSDPLPVLPRWAGRGLTWAPAVIERGGGYVMYYAVRNAAAGRQCISVATSTALGGPFHDDSTAPFICQLDHGGSIDPRPFVDRTGDLYLIWKSEDNAVGRPTSIWGQRLTDDGLALIGGQTRLLTQYAPWQSPVIEGPAMIAAGGRYFLFYGAAEWDSARAAIGYATGGAPLGRWHNASKLRPWMGSHGQAVGPSSPTFFTGSDGVIRIAYHAWMGMVGYGNGGVRALWVDTIEFPGGS